MFATKGSAAPSHPLPRFMLAVILWLLILTTWPAHAQLVFTAPPRESTEQANTLYKPIAEFFSETLGQQVVYEQPKNWVTYLETLVMDKAHLYFSEPHSVGFQIASLDHQLLARGPDENWLVVARKGSDFKFAGRRACLLPPPDFGYLLFVSQQEFLQNPSITPHVNTVDLYEDAVIGLIGDECQYTAVPNYFYSLFPETYRSQLVQKNLTNSPGQAFTASSKLSPEQVSKLRAALLSGHGQTVLKDLRSRFMNGEKLFAAQNIEMYSRQSKILVDGYLKPLRIIK